MLPTAQPLHCCTCRQHVCRCQSIWMLGSSDSRQGSLSIYACPCSQLTDSGSCTTTSVSQEMRCHEAYTHRILACECACLPYMHCHPMQATLLNR